MTAPPPRPAPAAEEDGLPMPRRIFAVLAVSASICITVLDSSMVNIALPGIARNLGITPATAVWLLNAYQLTVVTMLLPLASLGEKLGFKRVFIGGFLLFGVASLGAALASSFGMLLGFRVLQGIGSAAVMSLTAGMIRNIYPIRMLGRAIGINATVVAVSGASAPSIAAAILAVAPWQALFLLNVPVSLLGIAIGMAALPDTGGRRQRFDWQSAVLNVAALGLIFLGVDLLLPQPWVAPWLMLGGLVAGVLLVRRQLSQPAPLLPVDLLAIRPIAFAIGASICAFSCWYTSFVSLPFLLQGAGYSQAMTGLIMTPWPFGMALSAQIAGKLSDRLPTAMLCAAGMAGLALGVGAIAALIEVGHPVLLGALMALCGASFGLFSTPNNRTIIGSAPKARAGGAGGMQATARLLGTTVGTTIVALWFQMLGAAGAWPALVTGLLGATLAGLLSLGRRRLG